MTESNGDLPVEPEEKVFFTQEEINELISKFNKAIEEMNTMVGLLSQAFAMSLEPVREFLETIPKTNQDKETQNDS